MDEDVQLTGDVDVQEEVMQDDAPPTNEATVPEDEELIDYSDEDLPDSVVDDTTEIPSVTQPSEPQPDAGTEEIDDEIQRQPAEAQVQEQELLFSEDVAAEPVPIPDATLSEHADPELDTTLNAPVDLGPGVADADVQQDASYEQFHEPEAGAGDGEGEGEDAEYEEEYAEDAEYTAAGTEDAGHSISYPINTTATPARPQKDPPLPPTQVCTP